MQVGAHYLNHNFGSTSIYLPRRFLIDSIDVIYFAEFIPQPELSETELQQVESAYALEDRTWAAISKDRRVCAMANSV